MKSVLLVLTLGLLLAGCSPDNNLPNPDPGSEDPGIPPAENTNTRLAGVALKQDNTPFNNVVLYYKNANWDMTGESFMLPSHETDKFITRIALNDPQGVEKVKTIPLTGAALNYVRIKTLKLNSIGELVNGDGGIFNFEGSGSISFPPGSIYEIPWGNQPGYYGPEIRAGIEVGYLSPLSSDFGVSIPCYSMADDDNKRKFLASVGVIRVNGGYNNPINDLSEIDLYNGNVATLKMPILAGIPSAPDSVFVWRLTEGRWVKYGVAKKTGAVYTTTISDFGAFNFALPVKGVYKMIRLRTEKGAALINAVVRVRFNQVVVAESQSDWEGNAMVFLPADQTLSVEILQGWSNGTIIQTGNISSTGNAATIDFAINGAAPVIYTIKGTANACDGNAVQQGEIVLKNTNYGKTWYIPVVNGNFNAGIISESGSNMIYTAKLINAQGNIVGPDTAIVPVAGILNTYSLNTCAPATNLYMNFTVDGVATAISGDLSHPYDPVMNASQTGNSTIFVGQNGADVLQFSSHVITTGDYTGSGIDALFVNGQPYFYDFNKPMRVTLTRYDLLPEGFVIGSADFWYKDGADVSHHVVADFKLRRAM